MIIYLSVFCISLLACYGSYILEMKRSDSKLLIFLLASIAVVVISILSGCRDYSIGTDVLVYGNAWFQHAVEMRGNFTLYTQWATSSSIGYLYAVFNYIVAHFTNNPHWFYFWYSLIENTIVYFAIKRNKDIIPPILGWATYLFMFYNMTLNVLRNGMALVIILWGLKYIREQRLVKYLITVCIAYLFHNTSILAIIPYFIYFFVKDHKNMNKYLFIKKLSIVFGALLIVAVFDQLVGVLLSHNLLSDRYELYVQSGTSGGFIIHLFLACIPIVILYIIQFRKDSDDFNMFESYLFIATIIGLMTRKLAYLSRVTLYFDIYLILAVPFIFLHGRVFRWKNININNIILFIYLICYWLIVYGYMDSGETTPYIFMRY